MKKAEIYLLSWVTGLVLLFAVPLIISTVKSENLTISRAPRMLVVQLEGRPQQIYGSAKIKGEWLVVSSPARTIQQIDSTGAAKNITVKGTETWLPKQSIKLINYEVQ